MQETFTYDDMNRLTGITLTRPSGSDLHCRRCFRQAHVPLNNILRNMATFIGKPGVNGTDYLIHYYNPRITIKK